MRIHQFLAALAFATSFAALGCAVDDDDDPVVVTDDDCDTKCEDAHEECILACTDDVCVADCDTVREDCIIDCD